MTIKDIARLSGCGVATVSRVLNGHPDVSEATRQRVLTVVEEHGFQPNANAKNLKQQAGKSVAVLVKGSQNLLFADLVEQVQALLRDRGQDTAIYYLDEDGDEVAYARQLCRERKPLGLLFLGGDWECFRRGFDRIETPAVLLTNSARDLGFSNLSSLTTDDMLAARQAIEYLARRGHRHIGVLGGNGSQSQISHLRLLGCQAGFAEYGLSFDGARQYEPSRYSMEDAYAATGRLLERAPELTAIFAMSDVMAIGCIRALVDKGRSVPGDISVMGYDGVSLGCYCVPRLTTIKQDTSALARQGVDLLLERIQGRLPQPVHRIVPFQLVEGESVARSDDRTV